MTIRRPFYVFLLTMIMVLGGKDVQPRESDSLAPVVAAPWANTVPEVALAETAEKTNVADVDEPSPPSYPIVLDACLLPRSAVCDRNHQELSVVRLPEPSNSSR